MKWNQLMFVNYELLHRNKHWLWGINSEFYLMLKLALFSYLQITLWRKECFKIGNYLYKVAIFFFFIFWSYLNLKTKPECFLNVFFFYLREKERDRTLAHCVNYYTDWARPKPGFWTVQVFHVNGSNPVTWTIIVAF